MLFAQCLHCHSHQIRSQVKIHFVQECVMRMSYNFRIIILFKLPLKSIGYIQAFGWVYDKFDSSCLLENSNTFFTFLRKFFFRPFNELCWVSKLATFSFNTLFHFFCSLFFIPSSVRIYCLSEEEKEEMEKVEKKNHAVNSEKEKYQKIVQCHWAFIG